MPPSTGAAPLLTVAARLAGRRGRCCFAPWSPVARPRRSAKDEQRIVRRGKRLGVRSKAGVVRLDRRENAALSPAGVARDDG